MKARLVLAFISSLLVLDAAVLAVPRTFPPFGSVVVRAGTATFGEYASVQAAAQSLPNDNSTRSIFIYPGTYTGQVNITRPGVTHVYGYTTNASSYKNNVVNIVANGTLTSAGSDDLSGSLRVQSSGVRLYNINVKNTYGPGVQAIALSAYGTQFGAYGCGFYGYQDTLYSNQGTQVYLKSYIEGAVDFIFGRLGQAYFAGNTIAVSGYGCITASGRQTNNSAVYVFNGNQIVLAPDAQSDIAGRIFLGRPWADYARVIFKNTYITAPMNNTMWSIWNPGDERIDHVLFAEYNSTGPGIPSDVQRPSFATMLTASQAAQYNITSVVGSGWQQWIDMVYLLDADIAGFS
ncbi:carbohydrate esterase family 8 protein [Neolentinus lepideus HHB14362 ss-1]|uniref:Pectinesterase n=1 Tax=Neolentinus lepideus HHB14362 ss-1 TaxID=1314782 RepID=A0A165TYW0_9AGAM|nr:carbohydrate esterase family 8 protein [Neolentinus lepideus HHB14362 ss-1]